MCLGASFTVEIVDGKVYRNFKKKVGSPDDCLKIHSGKSIYKIRFTDPNLLLVESKKDDPPKMQIDILHYLNSTLGLRAKKKHLRVLDT